MQTLDLRHQRDPHAAIVRHYWESRDSEDRGWPWGVIRSSSIGKEPRRLLFDIWKEIDGIEAVPLSAQAMRVFELGHQRHEALRAALKATFPEMPVLDAEERAWTINLGGGWVIRGHSDGVFVDVHAHGRDVAKALLEIKTVSKFAMDRFKEGHLDHNYQAQIQINMAAQEVSECLVLCEKKDTQAIASRWYPYSPEFASALIKKAQWVAREAQRGLRPLQVPGCWEGNNADYGKEIKRKKNPNTGKMDSREVLKWGCSYCSYFIHCHPNFVTVLEGGKKVTIHESAVHSKHLVIAVGTEVTPRDSWTMTSEDAIDV